MSPAGDGRDEMTSDCFDEAFERLLAGHPVPAEAALLVAFTTGVRAAATDPGRPGPQLAQLLAAGLPTAPDAVGERADAFVGTAQPLGQRRARPTMLGVLAAAAAKVASARAVAQAATGVGIVLAGATGAGAAGVLPDPIQDQVAHVVEAATPFELPDSADGTPATDDQPAPQVEVASDTDRAPEDGESPAGTPADFGRQVSEEARGGGVDGRAVSERARESHRPGVPAAPEVRQRATERPRAAVHRPERPGNRGPATVPAEPAPGRP
jgi:hypothetical protein